MSGIVQFYYIVFDIDIQSILLDCDFFFKDTAPSVIYTYLHTLSLHDALPISAASGSSSTPSARRTSRPHSSTSALCRDRTFCSFTSWETASQAVTSGDRKSTRLNSSQ